MLLRIKDRGVAQTISDVLLVTMAGACFLYAFYVAVRYAKQPLLDLYAFRQTQTALTAYWLMKDGFRFAYETPVAGLPWSIPFEFPIYQYIVAIIAKALGVSLDITGRIVSFVFLTLCLLPARAITRNLSIRPSGFYLFAALLFSSPLYLYWGRTFMIETAAVFFSVAAIKYFVDIIQNRNAYKSPCLFVLFMTLSVLQKATTAAPVLVVLGLIYGLNLFREKGSFQNVLLSKKTFLGVVYFGIPLALGIIWTGYSDHIKELNGIGQSLTSSALSSWNWGSLSQRLSSKLYAEVIWKRVFLQNLSGAFGALIMIAALLSKASGQMKVTVFAAVLMGVLPFLLFPNLHIIHTYYQTANVIFLIYALAISSAILLDVYPRVAVVTPLFVGAMLCSNYTYYNKDFRDAVRAKYNVQNSRDYAVSEVLKEQVPEGKAFVAFGDDWNSSLAYLSERKSFTVPAFFKRYQEIAEAPEHFIPEADLGAVVICPPIPSPTLDDLRRWSSRRQWKIGETHGCYIAVPKEAPSVDVSIINQEPNHE